MHFLHGAPFPAVVFLSTAIEGALYKSPVPNPLRSIQVLRPPHRFPSPIVWRAAEYLGLCFKDLLPFRSGIFSPSSDTGAGTPRHFNTKPSFRRCSPAFSDASSCSKILTWPSLVPQCLPFFQRLCARYFFRRGPFPLILFPPPFRKPVFLFSKAPSESPDKDLDYPINPCRSPGPSPWALPGALLNTPPGNAYVVGPGFPQYQRTPYAAPSGWGFFFSSRASPQSVRWTPAPPSTMPLFYSSGL